MAAQEFVKLFDQYKALPDDDRNALVEAHDGELSLVAHYWLSNCPGPRGRSFDPCDAGYILLGLRDLYQLHYLPMVDAYALSELYTLAVSAAICLMRVVDFNSDQYDFGIFCYEHLGIEPGELVYQLYQYAYPDANQVEGVIVTYAKEKGWPLK